MEHYPLDTKPEVKPDNLHRPNIEKLTGWLVGMQSETRERKAKTNPENKIEAPAEQLDVANQDERDFERRREVRDEPQAHKASQMIAIGEVIAHNLSDDSSLARSTRDTNHAKQKIVASEEVQAAALKKPSSSSGLTKGQAIQIGIIVGVAISLLVLLWLSLR